MEEQELKLKQGFLTGTGRRKTATARVFLWQNKGEIKVNDVDIEKYFPLEKDEINWLKPFFLIGVSHPKARFDISIKVKGSGKSSQLEAVIHGISRVLAQLDPEFQKVLRKNGLLTRDSRMVERKKPYLHKARKAPQYSKR